MRTLLRPQWLLLTTTLPLALLALLCAGEYSIIRTLLPPASQQLWLALALGLGGLGLAVLVGAGLAWRRQRPLSLGFAVGMLLAFGAYLAWWTVQAEVVQPREVPAWMLPTDLLLYAWTFLMPSLVHALLAVVIHTTPGERPQGAGLSVLLAVAVPLGAWLLLAVLEGIASSLGDWPRHFWLGELVVTAFLVLGPLLFLYFLARACYILVLRRADGEVGLLWRLLLGVGLPVAGLALNAQLDGGWSQGRGVFGDFSSPWFFGLAVLNGLLLSVPARRLSPGGQLALLAGRSVLLGYTDYFFVVFLPWLPFSVLAIILIGTGFLLLAPLLLLLLHVQALSEDVAALRPRYGRGVVLAVLLGGAAVLPLALTASYYHDRQVLHQALDYAFSPDYARRYQPLDAEALARTLAVVRRHKDRGRGLLTSSHQPYLSAYFNWLVLDNLTLSDDKLDELKKLFGPAAPRPAAPAWATPRPASLGSPAPAGPRLRHLAARSTYDARRQVWVSRLDLEIANADPTQQRGEYATVFGLPPGCWVSGYYLELNGRREPGILAEQKAADWLFRQVVNQDVPRDPGLLAYAGPDHLRLHVYPVQGRAPRRTGFELLHREPLTLTIEGQSVRLGTPAETIESQSPVTTPGGAVSYLSAAAQQRLPLVRRQPYYHFLLDVSAGQGTRKADYQRWVAAWLAAHPLPTPPRFTLVSAYATPVPAGADWPRQLDEYPNAGGYNLGGAMRQVLADTWQHPTGTYPVLVAVTDSLARAILPTEFAEFAPAYPEAADFVLLTADGAERHSLRENAAAPLGAATGPLAPAVRAWPSVAHPRSYLPAEARPAVVLNNPAAPAPPATPAAITPADPWLAGLLLRGAAQWQALHPAEAAAQHAALVQASFRAHLLSPWTAFLALENEAQKAALLRKQAQTLAANANLDTLEADPNHATAVPLDDYLGWLLLLAVAAGLWRLRE